MFIVFLLFLYIHTAYCQPTTTLSPNFVYNCSFSNNIYSSNAAVSDQFIFPNRTSVILTASYAFLSSSIFELGLVYQFSTLNYLIPFPVIFNCASIVRSCQLKAMAGTTTISRDSEPIRVSLTPFNYTTTSVQFNQMGLYLKQGQYQLSNCTLNTGQQITDPKSIFYIKIQYEKSVGTSCDPLIDTCGSSSLTSCSSSTSTCTCLSSSSSLVSYSDSFYCADLMNISNCKIFPSRCITWCNSTTNFLCICPSDTLKIQRNNLFICELSVNSNNCSNDDNLRHCPLGQCCQNRQCTECSITTSKTNNLNDPTDERLRIALGVIAGLLGTSVLILFGVFCWLRQREKRRRLTTEKSLSPSANSSTSSLYISPIQQQGKFPSSVSTIYQLPYTDMDNEHQNQIFYRTDSFRQAVLSGNRQTKVIEHVSTKRDSFTYQKDGWSSPTFSTLEFIVPSINNPNSSLDLNKNNTNVYQIIVPSSPRILTHAV